MSYTECPWPLLSSYFFPITPPLVPCFLPLLLWSGKLEGLGTVPETPQHSHHSNPLVLPSWLPIRPACRTLRTVGSRLNILGEVTGHFSPSEGSCPLALPGGFRVGGELWTLGQRKPPGGSQD